MTDQANIVISCLFNQIISLLSCFNTNLAVESDAIIAGFISDTAHNENY
jgi:hypothetical protein